MPCPHLDYRREGDGRSFDAERAFCTVTESFVQPMRADICNDRYDLDHEAHCEIYRDHEGLPLVEGADPTDTVEDGAEP